MGNLAAALYAAGSVSVKVLPCPRMLVTTSSPPIPRARSRLIARPSPTPSTVLRQFPIDLHEGLEHSLAGLFGNPASRCRRREPRSVRRAFAEQSTVTDPPGGP